ncbi:hypothetical protein ABZ467_31055 [Streptomyces sp. NPDC005727]|uniref:hypothetical protein n=1 Tax=unclassified Streptomyces TaxID=2593676 RepID=UPI0033D33AA7
MLEVLVQARWKTLAWLEHNTLAVRTSPAGVAGSAPALKAPPPAGRVPVSRGNRP